MKFKKRIQLIAIFSIILSCGIGVYLYYLRNPWLWEEYRLGKEIINKVEEFRAQNHRLPFDMGEIEPRYWDERDPIYYETISNDHYIVWFGLNLGELYTYDSLEQKWR